MLVRRLGRVPLIIAATHPFDIFHTSTIFPINITTKPIIITTTMRFNSNEIKKNTITGGMHYSKLGMDGFTDVTFNAAADDFLERVDSVLEEIDNAAIEDVNLSGGVLVIETTSRGTFVINKQAPNVQLWLSSPVSGPHHYDMIVPEGSTISNNNNNSDSSNINKKDVRWIAAIDGHSLKERLEKELTDVLGVEVKL